MKESLLTITIFAPLLVAVLLALIPRSQRKLIEWGSLLASGLVFGLAVWLWLSFDAQKQTPFQFSHSYDWIPQLGISFSVGLDGVSLLLSTLTAFLMPIVVLASWSQVNKLIKEYYVLLFVLEITSPDCDDDYHFETYSLIEDYQYNGHLSNYVW